MARSLQRRHLEAVVAIADHGSVHAAARELGMAQPALSRLLGEAETLLGQTLFERSSQGSRPTAGGTALLAPIRILLRGLERLADPAARERAPIRLGCIARSMHTLMPALLQRVYPAHDAGTTSGDRGLRFRLTEGSSTALFDAVVAGRLDFVILRALGDSADEKDLVVERLYDERTVIICARGNRALPSGPIALARLAEHDWVLPDHETASRAAFDRFWRERGLPTVRPLIETRSFETNLALVGPTRFLSIAPESVARRHALTDAVRILKVRPALPGSPVMLVYRRAVADDPTLAAFRSAIHDAARQARAALGRRAR